ncbi:hypothetical protein ACFL5V_06190 [Fibrobacterota bacterium]
MASKLLRKTLNSDISFPKSKDDLAFLRSWYKGGLDGKEIEGGLDFKVYMSVFNTCSEFSEQALDKINLLADHNNLIYDMQEEYQPSYPPMSPVTNTFFSAWFNLDIPIYDKNLSLGMLFNEYITKKGIMKYAIQPMDDLLDSYCSFYEVTGVGENKLYLWDIPHKEEFSCECKSGYNGTVGEVWYVRLLPPLSEGGNWVTFNTPYVFRATGRKQWEEFFQRLRASVDEDEIWMYLKYGKYFQYWLEFVFQIYSNHTGNAIFSEGVPDIVESRPQGRLERGVLSS